MALDADSSFGSFSLPSLTDYSFGTPTPSRTLSRTVSRRASRLRTASPMSSSPMPQTEDEHPREEKIFSLDPRRFTPTLHANLVAEILALRREVESKNNLVLSLEENVSAIKDENTTLRNIADDSAKEKKSLKHQMQLLEGGTLTALEELANERDKTAGILDDVKNRLDLSQKKAKNNEQDLERTHKLWEQDIERWNLERRELERKVHVTEGRLKTVLSEIANVDAKSHDRPISRASGTRSAASRHRDSINTIDGLEARNFRLSNIDELEQVAQGTALADELQFDDDDFESEGDEGGPTSPEALPEESHPRHRPFSAQSHRASVKARRVLGLSVEDDEDESHNVTYNQQHAYSNNQNNELEGQRPDYKTTGTQYTPPSSPKLAPQQTLATINEDDGDFVQDEQGFEQSRQAAAAEPTSAMGSLERSAADETTIMVSSACQTIEQPLSPPDTPVDVKNTELHVLTKVTEMATSSTQTSEEDAPPLPLPARNRFATLTTSEIPVISIRPPSSEVSRNSVVLPPQTKNVSCQASILIPVRSVSVQTEEIRIDNRPIKLPYHLLPSSISSNPPSPTPEVQQAKQIGHSRLAPPSRPPPPLPIATLIKDTLSAKDRVIRVDSDGGGEIAEDAVNNRTDDDVSDDDSFVFKEPIRKTLSKVKDSWKLVTQEGASKDELEGIPQMSEDVSEKDHAQSQAEDDEPELPPMSRKQAKAGRIPKPINTGKKADIRRTALISSGTAAHVQQVKSPTESSASTTTEHTQTIRPPFPVPTRYSSRNINWNSSEGTVSPTPQQVSFFGPGQSTNGYDRPAVRTSTFRKLGSETSSTSFIPGISPTSEDFGSAYVESPQRAAQPPPPPMPVDDITSPFTPPAKPRFQRQHTDSVTSAAVSIVSEQTSVVDAIAQTMIGEWMWKYVRRRKSFGLPESPAVEFENGRVSEGGSGGVRHQRWVWVAPYERAVMWSSKQPMSGPALMGKSGRKLTIQSVLDVRDDTPMPKGASSTSNFGRSILILTPQRALKFTAITRERHYVWLSALSFLSHSSALPPDLGGNGASPPPLSPQNYPIVPASRHNSRANKQQPLQQAPAVAPSPAPFPHLRRGHPIRDSIRVAKGKERPTHPGARRAYTSPSNTTIHEQSSHLQSQPNASAAEKDVEDAAEPPLIPRTTADTRKRSNTNSRPPLASLTSRSFASNTNKAPRSYGSSAAKPSTHSLPSHESESGMGWNTDGGQGGSAGYGSWGRSSRNGSSTGIISPIRPETGVGASSGNFFEAVGTMRMEAFVHEVNGSANASTNGSAKMRSRSKGRGHGTTPDVNDMHAGPSSVGPAFGGFDGSFPPALRSGASSEIDKPRSGYRTKQGRKKDMRYWGGNAERLPVALGAGGDGREGSRDPFEGF